MILTKKPLFIYVLSLSCLFLSSCSHKPVMQSQNQVTTDFRDKPEVFSQSMPYSSSKSVSKSDTKIIIKKDEKKFERAINEQKLKVKYVPVPVNHSRI